MLRFEHVCQIVMSCGKIRPERERLTIAGSSIVECTTATASFSQVVMNDTISGAKRGGTAQEVFSVGMRAALAAENTEHLKGVGVLWLPSDNLAIQRFGLLNLSCTMGCGGMCQHLSNGAI
jgi:hypothetical protein